ncbi:MAG: MFS transporter [Tepidisphaeraceae bacterium]
MEVPLSSQDAPESARQESRLGYMMRALRSRNYRLFFGGQLVSLVGNFLTATATAWLVWRLTHSGAKLGLVGFTSQFPMFVIAPFAGVLVDRWRLRRVLVTTQTLAMIQSFLLAWLVFSNHVTFEHLLLLSFAQGLINAFDIPARQSFVVQMLEDRSDLPNAIALNSSMVNVARLLGPTAAGLLIAAITSNGEGWCFLIDGMSYIGVIAALLAMRLRPTVRKATAPPVLHALKEGFRASFGFPPIRAVLLLLSLVSIAGVPFMVLLPVFANKILAGGPDLMGYLSGASGVGALAGAIYLASRRSVLGISRVLVIAATMFGASLIAFAFSTHVALSLALMPITGASMIIQMAGSNTLLQTLTEDHMRGRVMAMFTMCFMGTVPIGSLLCGFLADRISPQYTVAIGGLVCIIGAMVFQRVRPSLRPHVVPIYVKRGILPEVALGVRDATLATEHVNG